MTTMNDDEIKILICEDDPDHRMLMLEALEDELPDATFLEAENGAECLEILSHETPQVLILDYRLGDMDGIELLEAIGNRISSMAVILVTSQGDERIAVDAMKKGVRDYLVKDTRLIFVDYLPIAVNRALKQIFTEKEKSDAQVRLKASEQLNRTILNQMAEAVIYADAKDHILHLNELAEKLLGNTHSAILNKHLADPLFELILPEIADHIQHLKSKPELPYIEKEHAINDDIILSMRLSPVRDSSNRYHGVILNLTDVTRLRKEEKERLQAFHRTVFALAKAVEFRDPYTAGHAANVATIATRIATKLGWDEKRVIGLRLACEVHDIGKIAIPAEILTRPTKLSKIEMAMLKEHPRYGYEILKDIKFPFPIAEAVYQHHETLDGSGYPRALSHGDIILEARVLCIADILDAITSDRPYRPGLGLELAVEAITRGRKTLYDPIVTDAILEILAECQNIPFWKKRKLEFSERLHELRTEDTSIEA